MSSVEKSSFRFPNPHLVRLVTKGGWTHLWGELSPRVLKRIVIRFADLQGGSALCGFYSTCKVNIS